jgi:hypothetical protein
MNKKVLIVSLIIFLGLFVAVYQYTKELQSEFTSAAYSTSKPANGHSWSEMECTSDLCVTGGKIGIGTDNPTVKLEVSGDFKASGDVCNGTGNCLSALATLTNACGGAATTYTYSASAYSGTYCVMGTSTPTSPAFPAAGSSTTWTCPVTSGSPISCTANHAAAPVNGVCGAAATSYPYSTTAYSGALCSTGTASPTSPSFPAIGSSSSWSCLGTNGGSSPSCTASRTIVPFLVNGAHTELNCTDIGGTLISVGASNQCRFDSASCPSGWSQNQTWSTTSSNTCSEANSCTTSSHNWANTAAETCNYSGYTTQCIPNSGCSLVGVQRTCTASITQIGCY